MKVKNIFHDRCSGGTAVGQCVPEPEVHARQRSQAGGQHQNTEVSLGITSSGLINFVAIGTVCILMAFSATTTVALWTKFDHDTCM